MIRLSTDDFNNKYDSFLLENLKLDIVFENYMFVGEEKWNNQLYMQYYILYRIKDCIFTKGIYINNVGTEKNAHVRALLEDVYKNYTRVGEQYEFNRFFSIYKDRDLLKVFNAKYEPDVAKVLDELIENNKRMDLLR